MELSDFKLSELREMYPNLKATSKKKMIELIELALAEDVTVSEVEFVGDTVREEDLEFYIETLVDKREKVIITCENSQEADNLFYILQYDLFPLLEKKGVTVMASSTRRDIHLNGTCYIRLVCKNNFEHLKGLTKYTVIKEIV